MYLVGGEAKENILNKLLDKFVIYNIKRLLGTEGHRGNINIIG